MVKEVTRSEHACGRIRDLYRKYLFLFNFLIFFEALQRAAHAATFDHRLPGERHAAR
jgi:hypothetical protein